MKRLAAVMILVALFALPASAQRGGSHGGFSGSHGGFSGSHGFSGTGGGISHGGFRGSVPGRVAGRPPVRFSGPPSNRFAGPAAGRFAPPHYISNRMPYGAPALRSYAPRTVTPRQPNTGFSHARMPYDGNLHRGGGGDHRHHDRDRFGFAGLYGWPGYPYLPWGWGDPYLFDNWDYGDDYDSQPTSNYATSQYPEYPENMPGPYDQPSGDQPQSEQPAYTPWPYSRPAPVQSAPASNAPAAGETVTLVFRDGRPNEQIHNYLLTPNTLSVLDQHRQEIPVDQIDVAATARVNREAGVDFAVPAVSR